MACSVLGVLCACVLVVRTQVIPGKSRTSDGDYNSVNTDGSFDFGYANHDRGQSYHLARASSTGVVGGRFGARDPATNTIKETVYTAGPRGFRAKGPNIHRKMDLDQRPRGPIGSPDDPFYDPSEDPSYGYKFDTRTYSKSENADSRGDVKGHYTYVDDVGERHDVSYIAGRDTGFHVTSAVPDNPNLIGAPYHRMPLVRGETRPRGKTAVQRGLDGSYRFISAGPDQRRSESSDAHGNVRGSYTFLDDKGVQRTVNYIAGPGIGYRIVKNGKDPFIPAYFPSIPSAYDSDFVNAGSLRPAVALDDSAGDDVFKRPDATAASGHVKPTPFDKDSRKPSSTPSTSLENDSREGYPSFGSDSNESGYGSSRPNVGSNKTRGPQSSGSNRHKAGSSGTGRPSGSDESSYDDAQLGVKPGKPNRRRPTKPSNKRPYVPNKPFQKPNDYDANTDDKNGPENAIGFDIHKSSEDSGSIGPDYEAPGSIGPDYKDTGSRGPDYKTPGSIGPDYKETGSRGTDFNRGSTIYNPGSTIIRNIGDEYLAVPPGVSVRAHVQSIDLYPYDSKPMSPSEAIEKDKDY